VSVRQQENKGKGRRIANHDTPLPASLDAEHDHLDLSLRAILVGDDPTFEIQAQDPSGLLSSSKGITELELADSFEVPEVDFSSAFASPGINVPLRQSLEEQLAKVHAALVPYLEVAPTLPILGATDRTWPLTDLTDACLFKYYIDEVAPWMDIADPDRIFQLVIPIMAKSDPLMLSAVLALSALHLLRTSATDRQPGDWVRDQLRVRLSKLTVIAHIMQSACHLQLLLQQTVDEDEGAFQSIVISLILLKECERLDSRGSVTDRCLASLASGGEGSGGGGDDDDVFPPFTCMARRLFKSPQFAASMPQSGVVQAAYLLSARHELYDALGRGRRPSMSRGVCTPANPLTFKVTMHLLEVVSVCWWQAPVSPRRVKQLIHQQQILEKVVLAGVHPIFVRDADAAPKAPERLPMIWYTSKSEVYWIQLAKIARAILTLFGIDATEKGGDTPALLRAAMAGTARQLCMDICAIAQGRLESPHAALHAMLIAKLLPEGTLSDDDRGHVERLSCRLQTPSVWPFVHLSESVITSV
jgi:hypothetical protein